jgi:hypothetical protein
MRLEVVTILPLFAFWAEEDLISEDWFEGHVISEDRKRFSLTDRELATITRPIEQTADHIDHHIGNLRDMVWREFKDWPRRVRSPAAPDPSPRVQKGPPALPRSPTPEVVADRPELVAKGVTENPDPPALSGNGTAATKCRTSEAPADRHELVAAGHPVRLSLPAPLGNGTTDTEAATSCSALEAPATAPENLTSETTHPGPPVVLNGPDGEVIVWGERKPPLTPTQYRVVQALVDAYASGERLSKTQLQIRTKDAKGNECEPLGILRRLRENPVWNPVISMAGKACRGYSLNPRPHTPTHKNTHKSLENHPRPHTGG